MLAETNIQSKNSKYNDLKNIYKYRHTHMYIYALLHVTIKVKIVVGGGKGMGGVTYFSITHCEKNFKIFQVRLGRVTSWKPKSTVKGKPFD